LILPFSGLIDEVRLWKRQRSQAEIQAAMNGELFQNVTAVGPSASPRPTTLGQNFPNPFNPVTQIPLSLGTAGRARLRIFDVRGRLVRTLIDTDLPAGARTVWWNGEDDEGRRLASGVYSYRLESGAIRERRRMILVR
jgi:flagellar hook assembly protein FlgD